MAKIKSSHLIIIVIIVFQLLGIKVFAITKENNEKVKSISNREIMDLVGNAHSRLMDIFNTVYYENSAFQDKEGNYYTKLPEKINTREKLFQYLNKYFSSQASNKLIEMFDTKEREGKYSITCGELGLGTFKMGKAKLICKIMRENKIVLYIYGKNAADELKEYKAVLIYENKQWKVDYWQWGFSVFENSIKMI
jgi:hypothetical protein